MIVIERESLARARGAHVHAVITSMGASNNHLGMWSPPVSPKRSPSATLSEGYPMGPMQWIGGMPCHEHPARGRGGGPCLEGVL